MVVKTDEESQFAHIQLGKRTFRKKHVKPAGEMIPKIGTTRNLA